MPKICITNPPAYIFDNNRHFIQAGSRWAFSFNAPKTNHAFPHYQPYPFSLGYTTSILQTEGYEVNAFDGCALDMDENEWITKIEQINPDFLITEIPTISFPLIMYLLSEIKKRIGCKTIIAGPHITALPEEIRDKSYYCLTGEWESNIPFQIKQKTLATYPPPNRTFFPNEQYSNFEFHRPSAQMLTSRVCSHQCAFCIEKHVMNYSNSLSHFRNSKTVVNEMEQLKSTGIKQIHFDDMNLTAYKTHVENICIEIINRNLDIPWTCLGDILTKAPTILLMADAGCIGLSYGVETINPETTKLINKPHITPEKVIDFTNLLKKYNIHTVPTYQIGLPETREQMQKTIDFAFNLPSDSLQFSIATPLPRTPFYQMCEENGWLRTKDWTQYDGSRNSVINYPWMNHEEIEQLFRETMQRRKDEERGFRK